MARTEENKIIKSYSDSDFREMFKRYFSELGITVRDWDSLFSEMESGENVTYLRYSGGVPVGFILFTEMSFSSWFFERTVGFIREFWVDPDQRKKGHGGALLRQAEEYFLSRGIGSVILTTDTAEDFYLCRGYVKAPEMKAKNGDMAFVKNLRTPCG